MGERETINQKDIKDCDTLKRYLKSPARGILSAYHYTSLESLYQILKNKTLRFSRMEIMNDKYEKKLFPCDDFFFCLSKAQGDEIENFGMWAMYGHILDGKSDDAKKIGVKIYFPSEALKELPLRNANLTLHSVAYTNVVEEYENTKTDAPRKKEIYIDRSNAIPVSDYERKRLCGFIKDSAWRYENEMRLRLAATTEHAMDETTDVPIPALSEKLIVYPSPLYDKDAIEAIFSELCGSNKIDVNFRENRYRNSFNIRK